MLFSVKNYRFCANRIPRAGAYGSVAGDCYRSIFGPDTAAGFVNRQIYITVDFYISFSGANSLYKPSVAQRIVHGNVSVNVNGPGGVDCSAVCAGKVQHTSHGHLSVTRDYASVFGLGRHRTVDKQIGSGLNINGIQMLLPGLLDCQSAFDIQVQINAVRVNHRIVANAVENGVIQLYNHGIVLFVVERSDRGGPGVAENVVHVGRRNLLAADPYTVFDRFLGLSVRQRRRNKHHDKQQRSNGQCRRSSPNASFVFHSIISLSSGWSSPVNTLRCPL